MKKTRKILSILFIGIGLLVTSSCETTNLDLTENPNALPLNAADPDLLLDGVQVDFAYAMEDFGRAGSEVTRLSYMFGRSYANAYGPTFFNESWRLSYQRVMKNIQVMNVLAKEKNFKKHLAMGKVFEAYTLITLVDFFGDVPYTQALDVTNLAPKADKGADVYAKAIILLDEAIADFGVAGGIVPKNDFYYKKDWNKWIRLANTIKMKILIQQRLVNTGAITSFNAIVTSNNFIKAGEDFEFNWGITNTNPDSRHPQYIDAYTTTGVGIIGFYQANWLMNEMINGKSVADPRLRYYFYRQQNSVPISEQLLRCSVEPSPPNHYATGGHVYCIIPNNNGYWGRDHGNDEGIPPDTQRRTAPGVYPAGGKFDGNEFVAINTLSMGAKGYGITPILLSSTVDFWRAEAALFGGAGSAKTHMQNGAQASITKVRGFISRDATAITSFAPATSVDAAYLAAIGTKYDAATTNATRLDVIITEMFISLYGNGIDAYNAYRRTGSPSNIQPNVELTPGAFIRSFWYPANEANTNPNIPQKANVAVQVFWDNNPATGFLKGN